MLLADGGKVIGRTFKHELPNYGTFDEKRIFTPGPLPSPIEWRGIRLGVPVCEDMRQRSREQVIGAALALLVTGVIVFEFVIDAKIGTSLPPSVTYVQLYPANRTDAQIIADQKKDQATKAAIEKEKQRQYRELEKRFGIE